MTQQVTEPTGRVPLDRATLEAGLAEHRRELTGYCYRMLGSIHDAEDAVQETMVRAWRALDRFEGRSSLRSWIYRIATNVCWDALEGRSRRATPLDLSPTASAPVASSLGEPMPAETWVGPARDDDVVAADGDPADVAVQRDAVRLAFVAALQHLPPRQRAVLILRDVLRWRAEEVSRLLDTTVASVTSALQRARTTMAEVNDTTRVARHRPGPTDADLLARYVAAFESYDIDALVALLHEDVTQNMPPFALWLAGPADVGAWMLGPGHECRGSRLIRVEVNGGPGFAQYRWDAASGTHRPWGVHALTLADGRVLGITSFIDATLFPQMGLPDTLR